MNRSRYRETDHITTNNVQAICLIHRVANISNYYVNCISQLNYTTFIEIVE